MKLVILTLAILCLWLKLASGVDTLAWDASATSNVTYRLRWATNSAGNEAGTLVLGTNTTVALTNGPWGRFYFDVIAATTNGIESLPSNELLATNRPAAPLQLRLLPPADALLLQSTADPRAGWKTIAVITSTNRPLILAQVERQSFRVIATNLPPPLP
jgi:hypothetical protein